MTDIETLLAIEGIKQLKARYFRALDTNDWVLFASTMTKGCIGAYSDGDLSFKNRDEIVSFMRNNLSGKKMLTLHQGHTPEITLLDKHNASGIWYLVSGISRIPCWLWSPICAFTGQRYILTSTAKITMSGGLTPPATSAPLNAQSRYRKGIPLESMAFPDDHGRDLRNFAAR